MCQISALNVRLPSACLLMILVLAGCAEPVREDRTVEFSRDGRQVAFQHGDEGVYVASSDGQSLTKIFQPDAKVLATSRPLPSPTDGRFIFTTAEPLAGEPPPPARTGGPLPPEGRLDWQRPVRYTCWLRPAPQGDQPVEVQKLFEAHCNHIGYVTAGLAVRWHPNGKQINYCASLAPHSNEHSIFEFDLATKETRRVFPHAAKALLCDWTPSGTHLVCVAADFASRNTAPPPQAAPAPATEINGTWIGQSGDDKSWWRVPGSERLAEGELPSVIEMLRSSRPAWTKNDLQFALVIQKRADPGNKFSHELHRVDVATRQITKLAESEGPIMDLHWSPDGQRLGYVQQDAVGATTLSIRDGQGAVTKVPASEPVRRFAGFDKTGDKLAYIVPDRKDLPPENERWTLLLIPAQLARDRVRVAAAEGSAVGQEIFSEMRVTFPLWSPTEEKLSLWLTFTPRYMSLLSLASQWTPGFRIWGLWPGDPAATIDTQTGHIAWMAVSAQEELQIGHYHLLKKDNAEAWKWYAKAREKLPAPQPPANWSEFLRRLGSPENSQPFEAICLRRLGRNAEAAAKWTEFEQNLYPLPPKPAKPGEPGKDQANPGDTSAADLALEMFGPQTKLMRPLFRDMFLAEVFLSVDGLEEALAHFRQPSEAAETDEEAFSRAVMLAQLLLISQDDASYFEHCTDVIAPLALKLWKSDSANPANEPNNVALQLVGGLCLAPLFRADYVERLPAESLQRRLPAWKEMSAKYTSGPPAVAINLILRAAAGKMTDAELASEAEAELARNPASQQIFLGRPIDEAIAAWFQITRQMQTVR